MTELTLDHEFLMSSHSAVSERALARETVAWHGGRDLSLLVGGLGLGCTADEALRSDRVTRVHVIELLPQVLDWLERGLLPLSGGRDPRLSLERDDFYARLDAQPRSRERWDVIVADVDHSPDRPLGPSSAAFYTAAGLARAARHLRPGGVLGVWSVAESPGFEATLRAVFDDVRVEALHFRNEVLDEDETNWLYFARA